MLTVPINTYAMAVAVEHVMRAGGEFWSSFTSTVFRDVQHRPLDYVMRRLDADWAAEVGDAMATSDEDVPEASLSKDAIELFVSTVSDVPMCTHFDGVLSFAEWSMIFADTINMADDDNERTIHVALVHTAATQHVFLCAWQVSQERNLELLRAEAEDAAREDNGAGDTASDASDDDADSAGE